MNQARLLMILVSLLLFSGCQSFDEPSRVVETSTPESMTEGEVVSSDLDPTATRTSIEPTDTPSLELEITQESNPPTNTTEAITPSPTATSPPIESQVEKIELLPVTSGFERPTYLTHAFDDRLFVTEQIGRIKTVQDGEVLQDPFLDISELVGSEALEQGLLSVAFHPNFIDNDLFFVNYTDRTGATVIASYRVSESDRNRADPASGIELLRLPQPYLNHNGGQLQFGPDGYLYIGMGDGGSAGDPLNNGQNPTSLFGKLLRINVDEPGQYNIPNDNPFASDENIRQEIWALGLRNPWRFSFDRKTGDLYIADVGQNLLEEINYQASSSLGGENYGWNILEGSRCYLQDDCDTLGYKMPVAEYDHQGGHCSVTGGYVYRGQKHLELQGNYFFADYCSGVIWSLFQHTDGVWRSVEILQSGLIISSFGEDVWGEHYILDHLEGVVYQIAPA